MPYKWPEKRRVIGTSVPRIDGALKVSGKAKYSFDRNLPGLLYGKIFRSPHAHAKIVELDLSVAEAMPGVKASHTVKGPGTEVHYAGDEIAALAAETEEQARDALRAIRVKFEVLPHVSNEEEGLEKANPPKTDATAGIDQALKDAAATIEGFYGCHVITHVCWESHGLVAHWKSDDELLVYASTQAVGATAGGLKGAFANAKVTCETPFMGGGFGSKFGPDIQGIVCAHLAKKAKRPVKLMLERNEEHEVAGNRPSQFAKVKAGVDKEGKLVAFDAEVYGTGGNSSGAGNRLPYVYAPQERRVKQTDVPVNAGNQRALRAPVHPQSCLIMEQVMDDLAAKIGMDPLEFRLRNLPTGKNPLASIKAIYEKEIEVGAEAIGWKKNYHSPGDPTPGPLKRGLGMGINTWGGAAGQAQATCTIHPDGSVEVACGTQDLGTGTTTLVPIVAAEILGLSIGDITGRIGSSAYPPAGGSGGSTTCGGVSLAVAVACFKALEKLTAACSEALGTEAANLEAFEGKIRVKGDPSKSLSWKQACTHLGQQPISESGDRGDKGTAGMSSATVGGAQFADVQVDIETGEIRIQKMVAVADCGMVMNRLLCESQVLGGVIGGINAALFEERRLDRKTGRMLNPDVEWYKVAGHSDLPPIEVHLLDYPERGVIGIGEPPYIPGAAAIANAVANAIGVRASVIPLTPRRVLGALHGKQEGHRK